MVSVLLITYGCIVPYYPSRRADRDINEIRDSDWPKTFEKNLYSTVLPAANSNVRSKVDLICKQNKLPAS